MEPLAVTPREAFAALGVGKTMGYYLVRQGKLKAIKIGRATRILVDSIRRVAEEGA